MSRLTIELYPYKVPKVIVRVLQKNAVSPIGFEVKGDVSTGTRLEGWESYIGGLGEGYGVPDVPWRKQQMY